LESNFPPAWRNGHDHFERRAVVLLVDVDRDPSTVVADADGVVVVDRDRDIVAVPASASSMELSTTS